VIGSDRTRFPVAWGIALATAAATPTSPTSPTPFVPRASVTVSSLASGGARWLLDELLKAPRAVHVIAGPHQSYRVGLQRGVGCSH
jgi:hypothetical protein